MTLGALAFVSLLGVPLVLGAVLLGRLGIGPADDRLAWPAWSWLTGTLMLGLALFAWLWLPLPMAWFPWIALSSSLLTVVVVEMRRPVRSSPARPTHEVGAPGFEQRLFQGAVVVALLLVADRMAEGNALLVHHGDEASIWSGKAKLIHASGGFGDELRHELGAQVGFFHQDYPLLNPLLQLWTYLHAGDIVHVDNRIPIQVFILALLLVVASALRRACRPAIAAGLLLLLVTSESVRAACRYATADTMVALGLLVAVESLDRFRGSAQRRWLVLAAIASAFLVWCKNEGLMLGALAGGVGLVVLARDARRDPRVAAALRSAVPWLLLPIAVLLSQVVFDSFHGLQNDLLSDRLGSGPFARLTSQFSERLTPVLSGMGEWAVRRVDHAQLVLPLFAACLLLAPRRLLSTRPVAAVLVPLAMSGYVLAFVVTPWEIDWHMDHAMHRLIYQILPTAMVCIAAVIGAARRSAPAVEVAVERPLEVPDGTQDLP